MELETFTKWLDYLLEFKLYIHRLELHHYYHVHLLPKNYKFFGE